MITRGAVALFCSLELHDKSDNVILDADGNIAVEKSIEMHSRRKRYAKGLRWKRQEDNIRVKMFWTDPGVSFPEFVRLQLYGTTDHKTIGCLTVEVETPKVFFMTIPNLLQRKIVDMEIREVLEFDLDVEDYDDSILRSWDF